MLVERPDEALLMVVNGADHLTLVLPNQPLPGDRARGDALVDLALRVLPAVHVRATAPRAAVHRRPSRVGRRGRPRRVAVVLTG